MSCNEWERGSFILPSAEWVKFRKGLIAGYNEALARDVATVTRVHEAVKAAIKGKRGVDLQRSIYEVLGRTKKVPVRSYGFGYGATHEEHQAEFPLEVLNCYNVSQALIKKDDATGKSKLQSPKKSAFPALKQTHTTWHTGDASIYLDNAERKVTWDVGRNNHACDHARASLMGKLLFKLLGEVKWGRGTGGAIRGNDEYREESGREHTGAGGSYLKDRFGPLGDKEYEIVHGFKPPAKPAAGARGYGSYGR